MKKILTAVICMILLPGISLAAEKAQPLENKAMVSYSIGYQVGSDFRRQEVNLDTKTLFWGIQDALGELEPLMSNEEMQTTLIELQRQISAAQKK